MTQYQPHTPPKLHNHGFTLVELMVTIAVMGIIATIAAPSFSQAMANQRMKSTVNTIESALKEAKAESLIRRKDITVTLETNNIVVAEGSNKISNYSFNNRSEVISNNPAITFSPRTGFGRAVTTYQVCDKSIIGESSLQLSVTTTNINLSRGGVCS